MKHILSLAFLTVVLFACNDEQNQFNEAPVIPPVETMVIDFGAIADLTKSAEFESTNWLYSATTIGAWNLIIGTTFAVPVAAFRAAINTPHTVIDNLTWQWQYEVERFTSQYLARLVGKLQSDEIKWEMYITKKGINAFDEFLWFEGSSKTDGKSGQWELYHSNVFPEKTIQIDWKRENDTVGEIKYTYVREKNDQREKDDFYGSTLSYGLQNNEFDIYVNVHAWNSDMSEFNDTFIEWSRSTYNGRVKSLGFFEDNNWHCWDSQGKDIICN